MAIRTTVALGLATIGLAGVMLAACGDDSDEASGTVSSAPMSTSGSTPATLDGRELVVTEVTGHDLVADTTPRVSFDAGRITVQAGCNTMNSTYELEGDQLVVGDMATTQMACDEALMAQDQWFADVLGGDPTVSADGTTVTITGGGATLTLTDRDVVEPDLPLEGTTWTLEGIIADDAVATVPDGVVATIRIVDGEAQVDTSCNSGFASAEVRDDSIVFGPLALTKKACPPEQTEVERVMVAMLMGEVSYDVESDVLTLTTGDRGLSLRGVAG